MKSADIRQKFIDFFKSKGHTIVPSSPLVPGNDPTLLFTNSGMVQFKEGFLGTEKRNYVRAASVQRCLRAGGKHNDLENGGYTARHHTFFEMLGNWSFGDYFKRDALIWACEILTNVYGLAADKLWATVYETDDEAYDIWVNVIGLPRQRVVRIGDNKGSPYASDNFWQMADTGPCGPCSEIFYDHGPEVQGGPPGSPQADGDRYIEIWNIVFMQFDRQFDARSGIATLTPLPKPCVDTGMGLERLAAVLQHVHSNYDIDLFQDLIKAAARETGAKDLTNNSLKVIADHIRACSFLIVDGVIPSNEGRGYVLRRIIRRAIRHGYKLGQKQPFFHGLVPDLAVAMGEAYPELRQAQGRVAAVLEQEEIRFAETLENGMGVLEAALKSKDKMLDGETVFKLYDTYGFPLDLTADIARERGVAVDLSGYEAAMRAQQERSREGSNLAMAGGVTYAGAKTEFVGYDKLEETGKVVALYKAGTSVERIGAGDKAIVVLDRPPFYAESGGQVGDQGHLSSSTANFVVQATQKVQADVFGQHGELQTGELSVGDTVRARVDAISRQRSAWNHSATHLLHAALRKVLGAHVTQKGSLVDARRTRFDFSHDKPLTSPEIRAIEALVNAEIRKNHTVEKRVMKYDDAIKFGAMALFGEKYGDEVRVLCMGDFSTELCGGTHVERTGDIGIFKIVSETGIAAGVRRIEAITADGALEYIQSEHDQLEKIASALKAPPGEAIIRITQIQDQVKVLERELTRLKSKGASSQGEDLVDQAVDVKGVKVLAAKLEGADGQALRETMDKLKDKLKSAVILLSAVSGGKVALVAGVTADLTGKVKAGELVNFVAQQVGGKGGGRPDMAQAGGTNPGALPQALAAVTEWVGAKL